MKGIWFHTCDGSTISVKSFRYEKGYVLMAWIIRWNLPIWHLLSTSPGVGTSPPFLVIHKDLGDGPLAFRRGVMKIFFCFVVYASNFFWLYIILLTIFFCVCKHYYLFGLFSYCKQFIFFRIFHAPSKEKKIGLSIISHIRSMTLSQDNFDKKSRNR